MYFLKFLSNFIAKKKAWNHVLKMPSNSLPDANLNLPEMKTKSPSLQSGGVHMYVFANIRKFDPWQIQHSLRIFANIEFK